MQRRAADILHTKSTGEAPNAKCWQKGRKQASLCAAGGSGPGAGVLESRPGPLPHIKYLIPAARQLPSRVNSQSGSQQNNEGLCAHRGGPARGGGDLEPGTAVSSGDWVYTSQNRDVCKQGPERHRHRTERSLGPQCTTIEIKSHATRSC